MDFNKLKTELDKGTIRPLYIFTGPEREVMNRYIKRIDAQPHQSKTLESIAAHMSSRSLFVKRKTYLIKEDKAILEMTLPNLLSAIGKNTLILLWDTIDKRTSFFKAANEYIVEFNRFSEQQLVGFVKKIINIPDQMAMVLAAYCGNDVAKIENECHKLKHLNQPVTIELIDQLVQPPLEDKIFDMVDLVVRRKPDEVFRIYYDLLELKTSPIAIVSLLYTKFKQIFLVQSMSGDNTEICAKTGLTFYQLNKARELVGQFHAEELLNVVQAIQRAEVAMKTGEVDINLGMEHLFLGILNIGR